MHGSQADNEYQQRKNSDRPAMSTADPEKAENILFGFWRAIDTNQILKSKESRKHILQYP